MQLGVVSLASRDCSTQGCVLAGTSERGAGIPDDPAADEEPDANMAESSAHDNLLAALDTRDVKTIQEAMASYADAVQGVQLQSAAFELVAKVNEAKEAEMDALIAEMRQLASKNPAGMRSLGSPPAMPPPPQPAKIDREPPSPAAAAAAAAPEPSELRVTVHSPELVTSTLLKSHHMYRVEVQAENLSVPTCSVGRRCSATGSTSARTPSPYTQFLAIPLLPPPQPESPIPASLGSAISTGCS